MPSRPGNRIFTESQFHGAPAFALKSAEVAGFGSGGTAGEHGGVGVIGVVVFEARRQAVRRGRGDAIFCDGSAPTPTKPRREKGARAFLPAAKNA